MNVVQNPVDAVENYSRYSSIQVPCSLLLGAFFQALGMPLIPFLRDLQFKHRGKQTKRERRHKVPDNQKRRC